MPSLGVALTICSLLCSTTTGEESRMTWQLEPFWETNVMEGESLFFIRDSETGTPKTKLLFTPIEIRRVEQPSTGLVFEEGRDYQVDQEGKTLTLPEGSRIPSRNREDFYPEPGAPNSMAAKRDSDRSLYWGEGHLFHDQQVEVTYGHSGEEWKARNAFDPGQKHGSLPATTRILRNGEPLKMVLLGDSISEGYNASGFVDANPHQPPYGELVARGLRHASGSEVDFKNLAKAGMDTRWGIDQMDRVIAEKPDLVLLAFGMNDAAARGGDEYFGNMKEMVSRLRAPDRKGEVILVATMLGNAEWTAFPDMNRFTEFRDRLVELTGEGVALADLTSMWKQLLKRKSYLDLSGNGLNHPNDFGHRIYAQVILSLLRID